MNIWKVTFELHWSYMEDNQWDTKCPESVNVVADNYESAAKAAKQEVMNGSFEDENEVGLVHHVTDARLIEIHKGQKVNVIAK